MKFIVDEMPKIPLCPFSKWNVRSQYNSKEDKYICTINKINGKCDNNGIKCSFMEVKNATLA